MPIIKKQKKTKIIRVHEKLVATKHKFSKALFTIILMFVLFLLVLIDYLYIKDQTMKHFIATCIVLTVVFAIPIYALLFAFYNKNSRMPYKLIVFDTKFRWFRVYSGRFYHIIRPNDIVSTKARKLYKYTEDQEEKSFGFVTMVINDDPELAVHTKKGTKKVRVFCANPLEAKELTDEFIKLKLEFDREAEEKEKKRIERELAKRRAIENARMQFEARHKLSAENKSFTKKAVIYSAASNTEELDKRADELANKKHISLKKEQKMKDQEQVYSYVQDMVKNQSANNSNEENQFMEEAKKNQ